MTVGDAESAARKLLETGAPFVMTREPLLAKDRSRLDSLPPSAQSFFSAYADVSGNGMRLSRSFISPHVQHAEFIHIGRDIEDAEVLVRRSDGRVFVVEKGAAGPDLTDPYESVWHYVLEVATHGAVD